MHKKMWDILSKKTLFKNKWVDLEEWEIRVDTNHVGTYSIEHARNVVVVLPVTADNHIVLLKEYYVAHQEYVYSIPAGVVGHDDHEQSAREELREEAGYATDDMIYLGSSFLAKYKTGKVHYYVAKQAHHVGEPQLEPSEDIEVILTPLPEFLSLLRACKIQDQAEVACSYLALDHLGLLS